jgi:hypothetical protein
MAFAFGFKVCYTRLYKHVSDDAVSMSVLMKYGKIGGENVGMKTNGKRENVM